MHSGRRMSQMEGRPPAISSSECGVGEFEHPQQRHLEIGGRSSAFVLYALGDRAEARPWDSIHIHGVVLGIRRARVPWQRILSASAVTNVDCRRRMVFWVSLRCAWTSRPAIESGRTVLSLAYPYGTKSRWCGAPCPETWAAARSTMHCRVDCACRSIPGSPRQYSTSPCRCGDSPRAAHPCDQPIVPG